MSRKVLLSAAAAGLLGAALLVAPTPAAAVGGTFDVTVVAGDGTNKTPADNDITGIGVPWGVTFDPSGDMYVTDGSTCRVMKVTPARVLTVVAGTGGCGPATPGAPTRVGYPYAIARHNGDTFIGDRTYSKILKIDSNGVLSSISGPNYGFPLADGPLATANVSYPSQFVVVGDWLYMSANRQVAKVDLNTMQLTLIAGNGMGGGPAADGPATQTSLGNLTGMAVAADGTVYISDGGNDRIYRVTPNGTLSTVTTSTYWPSTLAIGPSGDLYAGFVNYRVVKVDTSVTNGVNAFTTVAGTGMPGVAVNGPALSSPISYPQSMAYSPSGELHVANYMSPTIVKLTPSGPSAPQPPTAVGATVGDGSAAVSWTAPVNNGGSAVTAYAVQAYQGGVTAAGKTCAATAPAVTCTVNNLVNGVAYTYRVTATNLAGTSSESTDSAAVTPIGAPGVPTLVSAASNATGDATLTWTAPGSNGGAAISSYTVQAYQAGVAVAGKTCTVTAPALTCTVSGLTNGTAYTLRVKAYNGTAYSLESADSTPVTPAVPPIPAPGAPGRPTVRGGTSSIAVSWAGSSGQVTGYTAVATPGGSSCTSSATSCVIGVEAGTAYTVTVVAQGPGGNSSASAPSDSVTPPAPVPPATVPTDAPATLTTDKGRLSLALPKQEITIIGTGYAPNSTATIVLYSEPMVLGTVTTDSTGGFSLPVTVPAGVATGEHTFLAQGVDSTGTARQMSLPVTVPPTSPNTSGADDHDQDTDLPVPHGGSITLLNANGTPVTSVVVAGQGTYTLNTATGHITFTPVRGFAGRATAVRYRITDSVGTVVLGSYTAVVTPSATPKLTVPARLVTRVDGTTLVRVTHSAAVTGRTTVALWSTVDGKRVSFGSATRAAGRSIVVPVPLNALGRKMTARPGGYTVTAIVTTTPARGPVQRALTLTRVVLQHFQLPRSVHFPSDGANVSRDQADYLRGLRPQLAGVRAITCAGWTDDTGTDAWARKLSARRAQAVCRALAVGLGIRTILVIRGKATTGNDSAAGKARNRRTDITLHY
ncbi:fibronectin type III domain-containing protein [Actinoplanes bogorensis]|uniref:Fibronectin type III domain-containing protein n=1 Tax=Paractinoplanes bogorensis TaxID=1610840 RepID=A0ABS5YZ96_9ACTN|nr:fibronectin type III domain-containing protein [Actinoplanes bogorensis]MBU2668770.1 fibronectin type III domain-containing protein [Actinoplanes bogorensis]